MGGAKSLFRKREEGKGKKSVRGRGGDENKGMRTHSKQKIAFEMLPLTLFAFLAFEPADLC